MIKTKKEKICLSHNSPNCDECYSGSVEDEPSYKDNTMNDNIKTKLFEEFEKIIDNYYINRLAMHENRAYLHRVVDLSEFYSFLIQALAEADQKGYERGYEYAEKLINEIKNEEIQDVLATQREEIKKWIENQKFINPKEERDIYYNLALSDVLKELEK